MLIPKSPNSANNLKKFFEKYNFEKPVNEKRINTWLLYAVFSNKKGWFRLFRSWYGLMWKHKSEPLLFSEKSGHTKLYRIANYNIKVLRRG